MYWLLHNVVEQLVIIVTIKWWLREGDYIVSSEG